MRRGAYPQKMASPARLLRGGPGGAGRSPEALGGGGGGGGCGWCRAGPGQAG